MSKMRMVFVAAIVLGVTVLACGPSGDGQTLGVSSTGAADTAPPPAAAAGACGDGVCDEREQEDSALCPQDCSAAPAPGERPAAPPASGTPDHEPPINVFLVLHSDPDMAGEQYTFQATPRDTGRTRDGIDWLMEEAARHDLRFTALYNGWYPMEVLEAGDLSQFRALLDAGHEIGTHVHRLTYDPVEDLWTARLDEVDIYGRPDYDPDVARRCWDDASRNVEAVLQAIGAGGQNRIVSSRVFRIPEEGVLMDEFGFAVANGDRAELGISYYGHAVWNPWRPAASDEPGRELEEDLAASFVTIDHLAQVGAHEEAHPVDLSVPQLQRRFLMLYVEWLSRVRTGAEDRVWSFGFVYHPNYTDRYLDDLAEFLDWLDENYIGRTAPQGLTIARYATVGEIAREFEAWEAEHPGTSSFSYVRDDPYPYTYAIVPAKLKDAAYEAEVDLGAGVTCFRFSSEGRPIYLLWSDEGERMADLRDLSGQVRATDAAGEESLVDAAALPLSEEPLFVEPVE
jgi:hypothetical protein